MWDESSRLSDIPELAALGEKLRNIGDMEYLPAAREIVGANAVRALGKSFEAMDGVRACGEEGINLSAMLQAYNSAFFAAKAFCMLMGFSPLHRDSGVTVDSFFEEVSGGRKVRRSVRVLRVHKYRRWGHDEVWALTYRLVNTLSVAGELEDVVAWLRRAGLTDVSRVRNAFQYDDSRLVPLLNGSFVDFPGPARMRLWDGWLP